MPDIPVFIRSTTERCLSFSPPNAAYDTTRLTGVCVVAGCPESLQITTTSSINNSIDMLPVKETDQIYSDCETSDDEHLQQLCHLTNSHVDDDNKNIHLTTPVTVTDIPPTPVTDLPLVPVTTLSPAPVTDLPPVPVTTLSPTPVTVLPPTPVTTLPPAPVTAVPAVTTAPKPSTQQVVIAGEVKDNNKSHEDSDGDLLLTPELIHRILGPEKDTQCCVGALRGAWWLQRLANPFTYLLLSSVVALVQGIFYTYANATLTTVEKRFHLPSKISGLVTTGNDVIQLVFAVPLSFTAGRGHRPRWLALGMMGAVVGCLFASLPHFIFGSGHTTTTTTTNTTISLLNATVLQVQNNMLCASESNMSSVCSESEESSSSSNSSDFGVQQYTVVSLHLIAQMLAGLASLLYYSIGYTYMDDAVSKDKIPVFLAVAGCVRILGPVCGYSLAAWTLSMWVSPSQTPHIQPRHPHWIGAWWIGYLVVGACLLVVTWSLALLPRMLPGTRQRALTELREAVKRGGSGALHSLAATLRPQHTKGYQGMMGSLRRLMTNRVFLLVSINQVFFWFAFFGYITFKAKFLEQQFKMSAARANQYIAGSALAASLVGWMGIGTVLTVLKPRAKTVLLFMATLSLINFITHFSMVSISCDHDVIYGMDSVLQERHSGQHYNNSLYHHQQTSLAAAAVAGGDETDSLWRCSSECTCSGRFSPVCVNGSYNYYSGCHAACSSVTTVNRIRVYEHCLCPPMNISSQSATSAVSGRGGGKDGGGDHEGPAVVGEDSIGLTAVEGFCSHKCSTFYMYLILTVLTKMTHAASRVPLNIILLRCVEQRDKDLALGVFNAVIALGSSIPAPIIFGWAIDCTCRLWEETCGARGFCWLYDVDSFRQVLHGIPAGMMLCCLLTEIVLLTMHRSINLYGQDEKHTTSDLTLPLQVTSPPTTSTTTTSLVSKEYLLEKES
ncbi:hypothetical protein Pmani_010518 [Petrolisthes manimaculis]|uniref:Solute carrier organic anion transporter family member n=1 Tax=Petrolisthes manimaculis TaxID=1843537 RepID=A0AAE1Q2I7_9EUCA|nr:hypothetical protein Pmani_010518 [Petrolisthes manimaculis]